MIPDGAPGDYLVALIDAVNLLCLEWPDVGRDQRVTLMRQVSEANEKLRDVLDEN